MPASLEILMNETDESIDWIYQKEMEKGNSDVVERKNKHEKYLFFIYNYNI